MHIEKITLIVTLDSNYCIWQWVTNKYEYILLPNEELLGLESFCASLFFMHI